MKIGFYGATANNLYVFSKILSRYGMDVVYIRDWGNLAPMNQPVWEDIPFFLKYEELAVGNWSKTIWQEKEKKLSWVAPSYLCDPENNALLNDDFPCHELSYLDMKIFNELRCRRPYWKYVVPCLSQCDLLFVCGAEATILAMVSGKPFVVLPHGEDIRIAAGIQWPSKMEKSLWINHLMVYRLLRLAYNKALYIFVHDPKGIGGHLGDSTNGLTKANFKHLSVPYETTCRASREERKRIFKKVIASQRIQCPNADFIAFVPSRVDFFWKGHDRLFTAFELLKEKERIHFVIAGWGSDYNIAQDRLVRMNNKASVTFLPHALSKPILYEMFQAVDFVVDQFCLGTYGTAAIEAMSFSTPVLMYIDTENFLSRGWEPPPVLCASTSEDIALILNRIVSGEIDLDESGTRAMEWVQRVHGPEVIIDKFNNYVEGKCGSALN